MEKVRVYGLDETDQLLAMVIGIFSLPRTVPIDAIVVIPGLIGEDWRIQEAINAWETNIHPEAKYLLIPGHIKENPTSLSLDNLQRTFGLRRSKGVISTPFGQNTKIQADWLSEQIDNLRITKLGFYCAAFHMLRAYLTVLKSLLIKGLKPLMIPYPTATSPFSVIAATGTDSWQLIHMERVKIYEYISKGDLVSFDELMEYLNWFWVTHKDSTISDS